MPWYDRNMTLYHELSPPFYERNVMCIDKAINIHSASKRFWMQKTRTNWVFLTWSLYFIALPFVTIVLWFCGFFFFFFFVFLGFALHNIHAFHSKCFFNNKKKKKEEEKGNKLCFCTIFSWFLRTRLVNLFSHNMSFVPCLVLMSLFIALY